MGHEWSDLLKIGRLVCRKCCVADRTVAAKEPCIGRGSALRMMQGVSQVLKQPQQPEDK